MVIIFAQKKNNKNDYSKINKTTKNKKPIINYSSRKKYYKISVTQNTSKEKNAKKDLAVKYLFRI